MKIIIVGCGKVGRNLLENLKAENHEITVIDTNAEVVKMISTKYDTQGVIGNGVSYNVQSEAGIHDADVLVAVTNSDEQNLLCCLIAKNAPKIHTIARIRNPIYSKESQFIKDKIGLSMIINPEYAAANEIASLLRFPSAIQIDTFAKGKIDIMKFRVNNTSVLIGMKIKDVASMLHSDVLICAVERGNEAIIPTGDFELAQGDRVMVMAGKKAANEFFKKIKFDTKRVKNALIIGGGEISYYLSTILLKTGIDVTIVEKDRKRCEELCELLPEAMIIEGDGTDKQLLTEEGINSTESFIALTNFDEENVLLSLYAKTQTKGKLITKINSISFNEIINEMDLDSIVYPKSITADYILRYVRAMGNSIGSNVETLYHFCSGKVEALEFLIREDSPIIGRPIEELRLKSEILLCCINRDNKTIIPHGRDRLYAGDTVVIVTTRLGMQDIKDIFK